MSSSSSTVLSAHPPFSAANCRLPSWDSTAVGWSAAPEATPRPGRGPVGLSIGCDWGRARCDAPSRPPSSELPATGAAPRMQASSSRSSRRIRDTRNRRTASHPAGRLGVRCPPRSSGHVQVPLGAAGADQAVEPRPAGDVEVDAGVQVALGRDRCQQDASLVAPALFRPRRTA